MLTKYNDTLTSPFFSFDPLRLLDELYYTGYSNTSTRTKSCRSEATEDGLHLSVDLPGVKSKDLSVQVTGREVKIEGTVRGDKFLYTYRAAKDYDPETVSATLEDGVLTLDFEKTAASKPRVIDVKVK